MNIPKEALDKHVAVLGKTGSGKTYAAKGLVEHMLKQDRQVCVVDPTGAWWGLRLGADGKRAGFNVVLLGGDHADIPLAERSGAAVARLVTEQHANVVIDTSGMTVGEYTRWFIDFAGTLYTTIRSPLHLVIDEAHYFMPQGKVPDVDAGKMLHAGNRLMSGGRSKGIRGMLITQRPAKLHKDSLTCADTLIAMRVIAPQDRDAIKSWIDGSGNQDDGKRVLDSLASLKRGQGWVWYPEGSYLELVTFPKIATYDSSATPEHGVTHKVDVSKINLDDVRKSMAEAVKEAEANDPKLLRQKLAEAQRQLSQRPKEQVEKTVEKRVEVPLIKDGQIKRVESIVTRLEAEGKRRIEAGQKEIETGERFVHAAHEFASALRAANPPPAPTRSTARPAPRQPAMRATPKPVEGADTSLGKCERSILRVLAQYDEGCEIGKIALLSGYRVSGGFRNSLAALRTSGFIVGENTGVMRITDEGRATEDFEPLPSGSELASYWLTHPSLGGCERKVLGVLIENPEGMGIDDLAGAAGYEVSGGFRNALSALRTAGVIVGRNTEVMRASDDLFDMAVR